MTKFLCLSDIHETEPKPGVGISGYAQRIARHVDADAIIYHGDNLDGVWTTTDNDTDQFKDRMLINSEEHRGKYNSVMDFLERADVESITIDEFLARNNQVLDNISAGDIPVYAIAGNHDGVTYWNGGSNKKHDPLGIELLENHPSVRSIESSRDSINGVDVFGIGGHREIAPGGATPIEYPEDAFRLQLERVGYVDYLVTHTSPHKSGLDTVPYNPKFESEAETPVFDKTGDKIGLSVGSKAIREFIDKVQPGYNSHGHIHESFGVANIGRTISMNCAFEGNGIVGLLDTEQRSAGLLRVA